MGREVGGGLGMGKTCEPKAFSFQCMTEFTTKKKEWACNFVFDIWLLCDLGQFFKCLFLLVFLNL